MPFFVVGAQKRIGIYYIPMYSKNIWVFSGDFSIGKLYIRI